MILFETERLSIRLLQDSEASFFNELLSDPAIIQPVPQPELSAQEIEKKFEEFLKCDENILTCNRNVWGIFEIDKSELIGLALFMKNDEDEWELGYRYRTKYWGKGYGTEVAKGIIEYSFKVLKINKIMADAEINNEKSLKILNKFLSPVRDYYSEEFQCTNRRFELMNR